MTHAAPDLWLFFLFVLGVILLPGMDMAYVASQSLVGGLRSGASAVAGIVTGGVVHVTVAMTGIAAVLTLVPVAFDGLLLAGGVYMAWVGWNVLRSARAAPPARGADAAGSPAHAAQADLPAQTRLRPRLVFRRAVVTCLTNPKAYAFSLAVFPAFVHSSSRSPAMQTVVLAAIVTSTQAAVYGGVAALAAVTGRAAGTSAAAHRWMPRVVGPLLMAGALVSVVGGWRQ
jgi:threonine/homoserine/homoserine lactone efflux protein